MSTNPTDYDALARRYLDLWQQEMAKLAQDPQAAGNWATLFQGMMQNAAAPWANAATTGQSYGPSNPAASATSRATTGAAPAAAASGDGGLAVADVLRRIDARLDGLEQRLSALEGAARDAAAKPARRTKQPKPD